MKNVKWLIGLVLIGFWACEPKEPSTPNPQSDQVKEAIYSTMREWYYWSQELPGSINVNNYSSNEAFLNDIIYKPLDRFSYLTTPDAFTNAFVGKNAGHGFGFAFNSEERLFLTFVFDEAPAGLDGWQRGWEIIEINGKPISNYKTSSGAYDFQLGPGEAGITNSFTFKLPDGTETTRSNTKAEYQSNSVLFKNTYDVGGKKVGYWVYQSFKATAGLSPTRSAEVQESMEYFQSQGIEELIIDLRYNGGGSVAVAEQINNYLIQQANSGKLMYTNKLNYVKESLNSSENFEKLGTLNLSRIIFITSRGTASASELVINSLNPYLDIILIGDNTYGKPVGSFPLSRYNRILAENDVELVPITFATANSQGKADYFDGFPADFPVGDTPEFPWGDQRDARLTAALNYIQNGTVNSRILNTFYRPKWELIDAFKGLQQEFPAY
ncbi:S41 family peptidase [Algoriphagus sp. CAU 1675]|uniref:S41 family peptidase n=1 Tax=Algoriphagus sp. CAU 1675 TaxID=3032597 RepID=UPI0023DA845B|nr:S41 family peptidase [Algoriphagus sp. CAU 1675]MDF2157376.1 S41 family peptidase [Algoriphagus sp. CAU 1675]